MQQVSKASTKNRVVCGPVAFGGIVGQGLQLLVAGGEVLQKLAARGVAVGAVQNSERLLDEQWAQWQALMAALQLHVLARRRQLTPLHRTAPSFLLHPGLVLQLVVVHEACQRPPHGNLETQPHVGREELIPEAL